MLFSFIFSTFYSPPTDNSSIKMEGARGHTKLSRDGAVSIITDTGRGSGQYFSFHDFQFIVSARHVTGDVGSKGSVVSLNEKVSFSVFYSIPYMDISFSFCQKIEDLNPTEFFIYKDSYVGEDLITTSFPKKMNASSFRGYIIGKEWNFGPRYLVHSYGWFGTSGSVYLNEDGSPVGVASAIIRSSVDSEGRGSIEDLVIVSPFYDISEKDIIKAACDFGVKSKLCQN